MQSHGNIYIGNEIICCYNDYENTWEYDRTFNSSNLLSHISKEHLRPNAFQCMNVKRAFQVLGKRFACAIELAGKTKYLKTDSWKATVEFTNKMDTIIDTCNAYKIIYEKCKKRPLSSKTKDVQENLEKFISWSSQWSTVPFCLEHQMKRPPCFKGLTMTVRAFISMYEETIQDFSNYDFAIGLANQDSVEHFFSKLRQRGGFNPNPTARMVRISFRNILCTGSVRGSDKGNVRCDNAHSLVNPCSEIGEKLAAATENVSQLQLEETDVDVTDNEDIQHAAAVIDEDYGIIYDDETIEEEEEEEEEVQNIVNGNIGLYEKNAICYLAGFVARKISKKFACQDCQNKIMKTPMEAADEEEDYTNMREYAHSDEEEPNVHLLTRPTVHFSKIVGIQLLAFTNNWKKYWAQQDLMLHLREEAMKLCKSAFPEWYTEGHGCYQHRIDALDYLLKVKIHAQARYNNRKNSKKYARKGSRKLRNICNE